MVITKFFISFIKEKEWLDKLNKKGYTLESRKGLKYEFKQSESAKYEYVFLKNGKKSYKQFNYKSKDNKAKAIYANADLLLIRKYESDGEFTLFTGKSDKRLNGERKRTTLSTSALLYLSGAIIFGALMRFILSAKWFLLAGCVVFSAIALYNYYLSFLIRKYLEQSDDSDK